MPPSYACDGIVNLLSLDGGGVRGVCELVILDRIMTRIQERDGLDETPKPCDYFHLIGGTSTGGLIAILLGRLRMTTTEALKEYDSFASQIFSRWNRRFNISAKFDEKSLEKVVKSIAEKRGESQLMRNPKGDPLTGKAFVCAQRAEDIAAVRRIRAYNHEDTEESDKNVTICEAARATSAAPTFFDSAEVTGEEMIDGAFGCNNPSQEVLSEAAQVLDKTCKIGCVLSLGTGFRNKSLKSAGDYFGSGIPYVKDLIQSLKEVATDCELAHRSTETRFTDFPDTYFRFNVPKVADEVKLDQYKKIPLLKKATEEYMKTPAVRESIEKVVDILCKGVTSGITVGQAAYPDINQMITDKRRSQTKGRVTRLFTGRTEILRTMSTYFQNFSDPRREFLLLGMGGVGKTQIALKFADNHRQTLRDFWVDATDAATIFDSYHLIYDDLFPSDGEPKHKGRARITKVHEWMQENDDWLLILDNYDPDKGMSQYIPPGNKGNIIYTSRFNNLTQQLPREAVVQVNEMSKDDAITLLLRAAREAPENPEYRKSCGPIVDALGCLPLALDQAGAFMGETQISFPDYLTQFLEVKQDLLKNPKHLGANEQNTAVYTTFNLSYYMLEAFQKLRGGYSKAEAARTSIKILNTICFYHNSGIMEDMVRRAAEYRSKRVANIDMPDDDYSIQDLLEVDKQKGGKWDASAFRKAVDLLDSFSLLKKDPGYELSMHVLVHLWARDRMSSKQRASFSKSARILIHDAIPIVGMNDSSNAYFRRRIFPHSETCERLVETRLSLEEEALFQGKRGVLLDAMGKDDEAVEAWKQTITSYERLFSVRDERTLSAMGKLADLYLRLRRHPEAEPLLQEILERKEEMLGPYSDGTIAAMHNLERLYYDMGRMVQVRDMIAKMLAARRASPSSRQQALIADTEAALVRANQTINQMATIQNGTVEHDLSSLPSDSLKVPTVPPSCLTPSEAAAAEAAFLKEQSALWTLYSQSLSSFGPTALQSLSALSSITTHLLSNSHLSCAEIVSGEVMARSLRRFGPLSPAVAENLHTYATVHVFQGKLDQALAMQRECVEFSTEELGAGKDSAHTLMMEVALRKWKPLLDAMDVEGIRKKNERRKEAEMQAMRETLRNLRQRFDEEELKQKVETEMEGMSWEEFLELERDVEFVFSDQKGPLEDWCETAEGCKKNGFRELYKRLGIERAEEKYVHVPLRRLLEKRNGMHRGNREVMNANEAQNRETRDLEDGLLVMDLVQQGDGAGGYSVAVSGGR